MSRRFDIINALHPDVQRLAVAYLDSFPQSDIASGRRGIDDQARADAACTVERRDFLATVYADSPVKTAMVAIADANPGADAATLGPLFATCLGGFADGALSHFSLHLSGHAVDLTPVGDPEREAWCKAWVARYVADGAGDAERSRVLDWEDGLARMHVQLMPMSATAARRTGGS